MNTKYGSPQPEEPDSPHKQRPASHKKAWWIVAIVAVVLLAGSAITYFLVQSSSPTSKPTVDVATNKELATNIQNYLDTAGIDASVAISQGDTVLYYNTDTQFITASIAKVEIMTMVLEQAGSIKSISTDTMNLLKAMITESDNDAATSLYDQVGGASAMDAASAEYGMSDTVAGADVLWGSTETTAEDQLILLGVTLYEGILSDELVDLARELMGDVESDQDWGVSAAAIDDEEVWSKNGWDTEISDDGSWEVNSIGVINGTEDDAIRMAVLTVGAGSEEAGITAVEDLAKLARSTIDSGSDDPTESSTPGYDGGY